MDEDTLAFYRALGTSFGEEVLGGIVTGEDSAHFALLENGHCPNLDEHGLCRIISTLGEGALCDICREHPRFYNEVAGVLEVGVGVACEAAARLVLGACDYDNVVPIDDEIEAPFDGYDARVLRQSLYAVLKKDDVPYDVRRTEIEKTYGFSWDSEDVAKRLATLEYMDLAHRDLLLQVAKGSREGADGVACERFLAYLVYRHASAATSDATFGAALRMALLLEGVFARLLASGMDAVCAAILLSEEIEYSEDNVAALSQ